VHPTSTEMSKRAIGQRLRVLPPSPGFDSTSHGGIPERDRLERLNDSHRTSGRSIIGSPPLEAPVACVLQPALGRALSEDLRRRWRAANALGAAGSRVLMVSIFRCAPPCGKRAPASAVEGAPAQVGHDGSSKTASAVGGRGFEPLTSSVSWMTDAPP
jgi:hypothetical protein